jgi:hypothetical protein
MSAASLPHTSEKLSGFCRMGGIEAPPTVDLETDWLARGTSQPLRWRVRIPQQDLADSKKFFKLTQ